MRFRGTCYRAHDPRWAFKPLSGEGAKAHGGRFNAKGVPALYLALTIDGMFAEMGHGFSHRFDPLTVCSYDVDVDHIADLRDDVGRKANNVRLAELGCPWMLDLSEGRIPASWALAERLQARGHAGILVPSFAHGAKPDMANLVLWKWGPDLPHKVDVHDPGNRLPKDQTSWSRSTLERDRRRIDLAARTEAFAHEYGPKVRVNTISPGRFLTDVSKAWPEEHKKNATAAQKHSGRPEEIVTAALYLASGLSSFTTGSLVRVDGGIA